MKVKTFDLIVILCLLITGCATMEKSTTIEKPVLLVQYPLPPKTESLTYSPINLDINLFIRNDGSVETVKIIKGSGEKNWDSLAITCIKNWRFKPAKVEGKPISTWYRLKTTIKFENPHNMNIAEILCPTAELADSVYKLLKQGEDFGKLARQFSIAPSRDNEGKLGEVDINMYTTSIRQILNNLKQNEYSKPIEFGDNYVIFKRLSN